MSDDTRLAQKFAAILPHLNEKQRRLILAAEARSLGHGGISRVARASGISRTTIQKALREVNRPDTPPDRMRRAGVVARRPATAIRACWPISRRWSILTRA